MVARVNFYKVAPDGMARMTALGHYLSAESGLEDVLLALVRLRASLMNGCEYCIRLHTDELKKLHEPEGRIMGLAEWRGSTAYTQSERAALAWTEAVTDIQDGHAPDAVYDEVRAHFSEFETVNLTLAITTINAWNRIAIALGEYPGHVGTNQAAENKWFNRPGCGVRKVWRRCIRRLRSAAQRTARHAEK
jgi:AhpD family alkylhydroperoxidase